MNWLGIFRYLTAYIIIMIFAFFDMQHGFAKERPSNVSNLIANTVELCLAEHLAHFKEAESSNYDHFILTLESHQSNSSADTIANLMRESDFDQDSVIQFLGQKLNETCNNDLKEDIISNPRLFRRFGSITKDQNIFDEFNCTIDWPYQQDGKIILHYFCTSKRHYAPTSLNSKWCWKFGDPAGYLAVFTKEGEKIAFQGEGSVEEGDMGSPRCTEEDDPR